MIAASPSVGPLTIALGFALLEGVLQGFVIRRSSWHPIGDEGEYVERGRAGHPFGERPFHRMPVLPAAAWLAGRVGEPGRLVRVLSAMCSVAATGGAVGAAVWLAGPRTGIVLGALLVLMPERIVLGNRIWPDVYLAAATTGIVMTLAVTPAALDPRVAVGVIGALLSVTVLVRLDAVAVVPATVVSWIMVAPSWTSTELVVLIGPPAAAFSGWWLVSGIVLGQTWPDTTWRFNVRIARQLASQGGRGETVTTDDLIDRLLVADAAGEPDPRAPAGRWGHARALALRVRAMLGPDTFVLGKVLPTIGRPTGAGSSVALRFALRWSAPVLLAAMLVAIVWRPVPAVALGLPSLALLLPAAAFHARTRYRLPVLYGAVPVVAIGAAEAGAAAIGERVALGLLVLGIAVLLARPPRLVERC